jgi:hypothetical protein
MEASVSVPEVERITTQPQARTYTKADIPSVAVNEQPVQRRMVCLLI